MFVEIFILCLLAYLCGSIPFGMLIAKTQNIDIRKHGSGNIGATNVTRIIGKKLGFITLIGDVLKGWVIVFLAFHWFEKPILIALAGFMVFFGHLYSIFLRFKGGKGVATYLGILFALNIYFSLIFIISWFVTFGLSKYSSLASLVASISIPIYLLFSSQFNQVIFFTIMFILIFFTHRENIKRLKNKEETKTKIY